MAPFLPVRAISRSQKVRIGRGNNAEVLVDTTTYVDLADGQSKKDLQHHQAIGAVIVVGSLSASNANVIVTNGVTTDEGASNADMIVRTYAGDLLVRDTGARVSVAQTDTTLSAADATNPRIDIIQVNYTTGAVTKKNGTAAASPTAPTADAGNIAVAQISVPANDTAITTNQVTDVRPRG